MDDAQRPPLGVFRLMADSFRQFFAHFRRLFAYAFAASLLISLIDIVLRGSLSGPGVAVDPAASPVTALPPAAIIALILTSCLSVLASGLLALVALDARVGKAHGAGQYLGQTFRHILPLIVLYLVYSVAVALGTLLLVLPGLYLAARYYPLIQSMLFEDLGWSALTRARDLTDGYRWPVAALIVLLFVFGIGGVLILVAVLSPLLGGGGGPLVGGGVAFLANTVLNALVIGYSAMLNALIYLRLRELNDGTTLQQIAATVD